MSIKRTFSFSLCAMAVIVNGKCSIYVAVCAGGLRIGLGFNNKGRRSWKDLQKTSCSASLEAEDVRNDAPALR